VDEDKQGLLPDVEATQADAQLCAPVTQRVQQHDQCAPFTC
jgi:hypothetical protein